MIKVVKLVTGEDVVADIEYIDEGKNIILKKPQRFMVTAEGVGSIPFVPFSNDEKYTVSINHVILVADPDSDIKNGYNSQFGSGIVFPDSEIKV